VDQTNGYGLRPVSLRAYRDPSMCPQIYVRCADVLRNTLCFPRRHRIKDSRKRAFMAHVRHPDADSSGSHARKRSVASPRCARRIRNGSISPRPGRANLPCSAVSDYTCRTGDCANCCRNFARIVTSRRSSLSSRRSGLAAWSEENVSLVAGEMQDQGWRSGLSDQEAVSGSNSGLRPAPARVAAFFVGCANRLIIRDSGRPPADASLTGVKTLQLYRERP
jgi:hypothetical protein